jgi:DNA-directed RNA polymerase subunit RPC12/RpoP
VSSTATTCEMCDRPVGDTAYVCTTCTARTAGHLRSVVDLAGEVETTVARLARYSDRHARPAPLEPDEEIRAIGGLKATPLPYDPAVSDRWKAAAGTLTRLARDVALERGGGPLAPTPMIGPLCRAGLSCPHSSCQRIRHGAVTHPVARAAEWLSGCLEWLRHRPDGANAFNSLETAARTVASLVDSPPPLEYAGPCYADLPDGGQCQEHLYAIKGAPTVRCPACGTRSSMDGRREWLLREAEAVLAHATDIAKALTSLGQPVSASKIRNLAARGRIVAHGHDARDRPLYRVGEVRAVLNDMERRALSRAA